MDQKNYKLLFSLPVIVAALGYFVDIYDLLLFSIVRVSSLKSIGILGDDILKQGIFLINVQMTGLLIGGILWGIFADKKGRLSVLFGSILIYSLANIANGFVTNVEQYAVLRFIAGIGLAGELGVGITLVTEILPKELRGYGTSIVAAVGMLGAVAAYLVAEKIVPAFIADPNEAWRVAYFIGGGLGLALLITRVSVRESEVFLQVKQRHVQRGNFLQLFTNASRLKKYLSCIFLGMPTWFVIGILIMLSPEIGAALSFEEPLVAGKAVMFTYIGISLGDLGSGLLSQWLKSRKKAVLLFLVSTALLIVLYVVAPIKTSSFYYFTCVLLGLGVGYWALFVTIAAEQFGTNLRATVATTVPNFIRGTLPMLNFFFLSAKASIGIVYGVLTVGLITVLIALIALSQLGETFSKDLNFEEID